MARSGQESGVREIRLRRSMRRGLETDPCGHRASPRPYIRYPGRITGWLKSGASMEALAQLLSQKPALIGHPAVYHQITRLLWLPRVPDEGEEGFLPDVDYCPPAGTRQAARDSLLALVEAWVQ